jgi:hypothetical protein
VESELTNQLQRSYNNGFVGGGVATSLFSFDFIYIQYNRVKEGVSLGDFDITSLVSIKHIQL